MVEQPPMTVGAIAPETQEYWNATGQGRLLLRHCSTCSRPHHYPRTLCPFCGSETEWRACSGLGVILSFSIQRRVPQEYVVAYVQLDEGIAILTRIVGCDFDSLTIGQQVTVAFEASTDGKHVPVFRLASKE
jgi:uncharacterized OB-fold protein